MDTTGSGTSAPPCASVRSCRSTTSGTSLGPRAAKDTPRAMGGRGPKMSRSLPGRPRAVTPQHAHGGHQPELVPRPAHREAPYDRSPRGGARAVLTPRKCKTANRNNARRQGTLADPVAAAARRLPRHGELFSMRVWTRTTGAPATLTPIGHHLPAIPDARPRGPAPNGRTSRPFSCQSSASDRQRFTRAPARRQTERPAHRPPPSHSQRPTRCRGDHTPRTRAQGSPRPTQGLCKGWRDSPAHSPQTAEAQRAHRNNGGATRAAQGRTQKLQIPPAPRSPLTHCPAPRPARCPSNASPPQNTQLEDTLAPPQGTPPRLAPRWTGRG